MTAFRLAGTPVTSRRAAQRAGTAGTDVPRPGPNWYAAIMGTGIVANAGAILPLRIPGLRVFATAVWALAAAALIALTAAWAVHWIRFRAGRGGMPPTQ
ncbi:MAG TPA: hypothetical protein VF788_15415 [Pseudonocardiaceae bacterium]